MGISSISKARNTNTHTHMHARSRVRCIPSINLPGNKTHSHRERFHLSRAQQIFVERFRPEIADFVFADGQVIGNRNSFLFNFLFMFSNCANTIDEEGRLTGDPEKGDTEIMMMTMLTMRINVMKTEGKERKRRIQINEK